MTYMDARRQDPVAEIEAAIAALRHTHRRGGPAGFGPRGGFGGPHAGQHGGPHRVMHEMDPRRGLPGAARFRLLDALRAGPSSVSELSERIGVDQPRASRLVADAAMRGLVDRHPDPTDARRIVVELTDAGTSLFDRLRASRRSSVENALAGFTADERATFAALLQRFVAELGEQQR